MATAYTSLLGLALPVTGELSGTWGNTVNTEITSLLDSAIAGTTTISTDADITLTTTTGAANEAREAIILWTAGGTTTRNITAPAQSKAYIVINKSSSTQSIVLRGAGPTTGVTIIKDEAAVCAWNGSDFIKVANISGAGVFTSITDSGNLTFTGTGNRITGDFSNATIASRVAFQTSTANSNTIVSSIPSGTATITGFDFYNNSDTTNCGRGRVAISTVEFGFDSTITGTGTYVPVTFKTSGSERMRIDSSGNVGIGTSSPLSFGGTNLQVQNSTIGSIVWSNGTYIGQLLASATAEVTIGSRSNHPLRFVTNDTERMRIDTSGNVGIGNTAANVNDQVGAVRPLLVSKSDSVTTIAGSQAAIVIGNSDTTTSNTSQLSFAAITGASATYFTSAAINCIFGARTNAQYPTGQLTFSTSTTLNAAPTEKMRIDSSGNVGIGTSSMSGAGFLYANTLRLRGSDTFQIYESAASTNLVISTASGAIIFSPSLTERMRIDTSGNVLVGTATASAKFNVVSSADVSYFETSGSTATCSYFKVPGTTAFYALFQNSSGTNIGSIRTTDGTTVQYNTSSDYRLKDNVVPMTGALARVASLKPCTYTWKSTGQTSQGFIAHELQAVVPECVSGEKDAVDADGKPIHQGIDTSFLVATLTAAIQEQQALITSLTARIAALEST